MTKYLRCHSAILGISVGKRYEVIGENTVEYLIADDTGNDHSFTKYIDECGESYRTWFILEKEAEAIETVIENVTVLTDELGLDREYREVKRNAEESEKIRVIAIHPSSSKNGDVSVGDVFTAKMVDGAGDIIEVVERKFNGIISPSWEGLREYVVLEPSDIIRINGERFRLVERKAAVGERVVITKTYRGNVFFSVGNIGLVERVFGGLSIYVIFNGFDNVGYDAGVDGIWYVGGGNGDSEYAVLEPLTPASTTEQPTQPSDQQAQIDGLLDTVANLARRLTKAESELAKVKRTADTAESNLDDLADRERNLRIRLNRIEGKAEKTVAHKPLTRDEIIEKAKVDVAELVERYTGTASYVKFAINRQKRTVVALRYYLGMVDNRGIAKCAPDDVFNVHIGKALALRRALGLEVPQEYVKAPQPTEIKAGDVVRLPATKASREVERVTGSHVHYTNGRCNSRHIPKTIDDSRDGRYGEVYSE